MAFLSCGKNGVESHLWKEINERFLVLVSQLGGHALLIYDSSDDLDVTQQFIPSCNMKVHVIITTRCRDHKLMRPDNVIELPQLDEDAAIKCFCCWAGKSSDYGKMAKTDLDEIRQIVTDRQVKLLPLAIRRVATYTKQTRVTYTDMKKQLSLKKESVRYPVDDLEDILRGSGLQHLQHKLTTLNITRIDQMLAADVTLVAKLCDTCPSDNEKLKNLQERLKVDREAPMHWDFDLQEVAKRSETAEKILSFTSLMDTSAIPTRVLYAAAMCDRKSTLEENEFKLSLNLLSDGFSLLTWNDKEMFCDIHALVQQAVLSHIKRRDKYLPSLIRLTECMQDMLPNSVDDIQRNLNDSKLIALVPHVYSVCNHILKLKCTQKPCLLKFLQLSCWLAKHLHDITIAKHLAEERLEIFRQLDGQSMNDAIEMSDCEYNLTYNNYILI